MLPIALIVMMALAMDWVLGEPRTYHPLAGFGHLVRALETRLYRPSRIAGVVAVILILGPMLAASRVLFAQNTLSGVLFSVVILYFSIGHKSLHDHAKPIITALARGDEAAARTSVARIVSRDPASLRIIPAACESILENGNDAVFGALFWFVCAGAPGVLLYRLANTLDAMWGYKNSRYRQFGWAAARLDDILNWLPARLTAGTYALLGHTRQALRCWWQQAPQWDSPNAGAVMAAGAGALQVRLGGPAQYQGTWHPRPVLGTGCEPSLADVERALRLVRHGVFLWLAILSLWEVFRA